MKTYYFNSGVKPWNTDVEKQIAKGNIFINNEMRIPFFVSDDIPDNLILKCLMDNPYNCYNNENSIITKILGGNMCSKYAVFYKPQI